MICSFTWLLIERVFLSHLNWGSEAEGVGAPLKGGDRKGNGGGGRGTWGTEKKEILNSNFIFLWLRRWIFMRFNFVFDNAELLGGYGYESHAQRLGKKVWNRAVKELLWYGPSPTIPSNAMQPYSTRWYSGWMADWPNDWRGRSQRRSRW